MDFVSFSSPTAPSCPNIRYFQYPFLPTHLSHFPNCTPPKTSPTDSTTIIEDHVDFIPCMESLFPIYTSTNPPSVSGIKLRYTLLHLTPCLTFPTSSHLKRQDHVDFASFTSTTPSFQVPFMSSYAHISSNVLILYFTGFLFKTVFHNFE